ncbi:hypothetical protein LTS17_008088 [Exophiala oligosperma]
MPSITCHAGTGDNFYFAYCPSLAAAVIFAVLFGITTTTHIAQAIRYRKAFATVLIMGAAWETGGYVVRTLAVYHQLNETLYTVQQLLVLLAPLWINAYIYMLLGRMIHFFLRSDSVFKVPARSITRMFVIFDITAFFIQAIGGVMAGPDASAHVQRLGMNIYMAGVGVQLGFLVVFTSLAVRFQLNLKRQQDSTTTQPRQLFQNQPYTGISPFDEEENATAAAWPKNDPLDDEPYAPYPSPTLAKRLLVALYAVMFLVIIRNAYRLAEFAQGENSPAVTHEWFGYVFDATPMFVATVVLNVWNPGKVLQGARSDFGRQDKARKRAKREKKVAKKEAKREAKQVRKDQNQEKKENNDPTFVSSEEVNGAGYAPLQRV